ncbi:hypothetical protein LX36DRAFT_271357 [Colletotrichum falcatum]|nr:hypothetical protein LX36DRAFT_271357 [Colletotrichum falcatum]
MGCLLLLFSPWLESFCPMPWIPGPPSPSSLLTCSMVGWSFSLWPFSFVVWREREKEGWRALSLSSRARRPPNILRLSWSRSSPPSFRRVYVLALRFGVHEWVSTVLIDGLVRACGWESVPSVVELTQG